MKMTERLQMDTLNQGMSFEIIFISNLIIISDIIKGD